MQLLLRWKSDLSRRKHLVKVSASKSLTNQSKDRLLGWDQFSRNYAGLSGFITHMQLHTELNKYKAQLQKIRDWYKPFEIECILYLDFQLNYLNKTLPTDLQNKQNFFFMNCKIERKKFLTISNGQYDIAHFRGSQRWLLKLSWRV